MERKIGEIFEYDGEWYQCVKPSNCSDCSVCAFNKDPMIACPTCEGLMRMDGNDVIFKKLEKVGEPYDDCGTILQRFRIYTNVTNADTKGLELHIYSNNTIGIEIKQNKEDMEENKLNLKPFDLQKAKDGKPVCTRDGHKARIICFDRKDIKSIVALVTFINGTSVTEKAFYYFEDGCHLSKNDNNIYDLMMLPEKHEGWVNICKDVKDDDRVVFGRIFESREDAVESASNNDRYITIATVRIEWEE